MRQVKGFLETSFVDWRGKISAVLFLGGCNFRCPYCHNHRLVLNPDELDDLPWQGVVDGLRRLQGWVDGVCITGGEPTLCDCLEEIIQQIRSLGLLVKLDTNGSRPEILKRLIQGDRLDAVSMDVKAPLDPGVYARCAGRSVSLIRIRESIRLLEEAHVEVEFRTTVVPGLLDAEDVAEIARSLKRGLPYRIQGFRPEEVLDATLRGVKPYTEEALNEMRARVEMIRCESAGPPVKAQPISWFPAPIPA
jgi:pyruvate formate lyase activating enzyme